MRRKLFRLTASSSGLVQRRWKIGCRGIAAVIGCAWAASAAAQTGMPAPVPSLTLTNIMQIWDVSGEAARQPQRIKTEVVIYYFDPSWVCAFGECLGRKTFLPIYDAPVPLKAGQRVALDGLVIPAQVHFLWDKTTIRVLEEDALPPAVEVSDLNKAPKDISGCLISVEGVVGSIRFPDSRHVQMDVLCGFVPVGVNLLAATNVPSLPFKEGDYVRLKGVFVSTLDHLGNRVDSSLWVAQCADVEVTGSLSTDPRFAIPVTPVEEIFNGLPDNRLIRVTGMVHGIEPGKGITLWCDTGQVSVQSEYLQPLELGDRVEAVGFPFVVGVQACLRKALYRVVEKAAQTNTATVMIPPSGTIYLAAQIQCLDPEEIKRHQPVKLRGVLMWSHHNVPFAYVEDASGGIRVANPFWQDTNCVPGAIVSVRGNVAQGDYAPVVTNAVIGYLGWRGFDAAQPVSLEQALLGAEDGRWVEMRGLVREVTQVEGLTRLALSTSQGEFQAWIPTPSMADSLAGTIVSIDGICSAIANNRRQLTGIQLWTPDPIFIRIDQSKATDVFAADFRPLGNLRQFNFQNDLNQRVKTTGTVILHQPGRHLYLQDGADSVFALCRQTDRLRLGDRVEVAGFPGNEHGKFLLREAVFHRLAAGAEPAPLPLSAVNAVKVDLGGLLARAEGVLLNAVQKDNLVRLLVRSGGSTFEASLDSAEVTTASLPPVGSRLALTGVYEVQNDEYDRPGSFLLLLRSWDDVRMLARPPWWTPLRLLVLLAVVVTVFVISLVWGILISRGNSLLRQAQAALQTANKELESFSYSVSHDLRAPLRSIDGFSRALLEDYSDKLDAEGKEDLQTVRTASQQMGRLIDDLLRLSQINRGEMRRTEVNLSQLAGQVAGELKNSEPGRDVEFVIAPNCVACGDASLLGIVLENGLGNAWKYTGQKPSAKIEFGLTGTPKGPAYFIRDNGCGFDMKYAHKLFGAFQRLHSASQFPGTGIGLASVQRVIHRHGGHVWIEGKADQGTTLYFTLPKHPLTP